MAKNGNQHHIQYVRLVSCSIYGSASIHRAYMHVRRYLPYIPWPAEEQQIHTSKWALSDLQLNHITDQSLRILSILGYAERFCFAVAIIGFLYIISVSHYFHVTLTLIRPLKSTRSATHIFHMPIWAERCIVIAVSFQINSYIISDALKMVIPHLCGYADFPRPILIA